MNKAFGIVLNYSFRSSFLANPKETVKIIRNLRKVGKMLVSQKTTGRRPDIFQNNRKLFALLMCFFMLVYKERIVGKLLVFFAEDSRVIPGRILVFGSNLLGFTNFKVIWLDS